MHIWQRITHWILPNGASLITYARDRQTYLNELSAIVARCDGEFASVRCLLIDLNPSVKTMREVREVAEKLEGLRREAFGLKHLED